ncbi:glucose-1-phosphate thymidylyltransferase, partial [bacterium]|nr:glucose-1-phosphate thymidylyltransferase [bacterium]
EERKMRYIILGEGDAWFDCGTKDDLLDCANFIKALQHRANVNIGL